METNLKHIFETIYGAESDAIFRFCLVRVSNREQAMDITQETFLRLWQSLSQDKKIHNNKAFLFTVARNLVIDWYRKKKSLSLGDIIYGENGEEVEHDVLDETTSDSLGLKAEGRYLLNQISKLSESYQHPVYLRFVEDLSPQEIGEILGISPNAASVRINRGIEELRKNTGYYGIDEDK